MDHSQQPKIIGFLGTDQMHSRTALSNLLKGELKHIQSSLGGRIIATTQAIPGTSLVFLKTCIELRIPVILLFSKETAPSPDLFAEDWDTALMLYSMALTQYHANDEFMLDWTDAMLVVGDLHSDAQDLGIPHLTIELENTTSHWPVPLDQKRQARHGFANRFDLMEFLDSRYEKCETPKKQ
jgi:hypothetical protein